MRRMHVADFKTRTFTCEPAGAERRQAAFVRDFGQRIGLVHELGKLARSEKLINNRRDRFGVNQVMRHHGFDVLQTHFFLDGPLHPHQADAVLVFDELAHGTHPTVAQVVDVVDTAVARAVFKIDQVLDGGQNVLVAQNRQIGRYVQPELVVHLRPADIR